jgi:hypothetical protein
MWDDGLNAGEKIQIIFWIFVAFLIVMGIACGGGIF